MADMLSQEEVDALLSAFRKENGDAEGGLGKNDLLEERKVTAYNFRRPDRVSKEQLRSLELIHEAFARNLAVSLSGYLRTLCEINLVSVDQMTYNEFVLSLPNPTCFNIFSILPLEGNIVIEINPTIVFPVLDRLLGGAGGSLGEMRALTDLELQMLDGILNRVITHLSDTWAEVVPLKFHVEAKETNPQVAQIVSLAEIVILLAFEVRIGEASGFLNICIPFVSIESIADKLSMQSRFMATRKHTEDSQDRVRELINQMDVPLTVDLGKVNISIRELLDLRKGDVVNVEKSVNDTFLVKVSDQPKFFAKPGVLNRKKAIKIEKQYEE